MLLGIGFKVILISTVLVGVLVPTRARMAAGRGTSVETEDGPFATHAIIGLVRPLAQFLDLIVIEAKVAAAERKTPDLAAALVFAAPLSAFAVIPFGMRYRLGATEFDLVVANLDWGIVWLLGAAMLSIYGSIALVPDTVNRVRDGLVKISYAAGAGLALAALAMVFGTLNPSEIALAQDRDLSIGAFFGPALAEFQDLQLPGWGMLLQPISLLLYTVCGLGMLQTTAADSPAEPGRHLSGTHYLLVRTGEHLDNAVIASVLVALFLGGGAIPYVSGSMIIEAVGAFFGSGFATLLCMLIHSAVFFAKVVVVMAAIAPLGRRLKSLSFETSLNLCWKAMVPLALLNLFVTAHLLLASGTPQ